MSDNTHYESTKFYTYHLVLLPYRHSGINYNPDFNSDWKKRFHFSQNMTMFDFQFCEGKGQQRVIFAMLSFLKRDVRVCVCVCLGNTISNKLRIFIELGLDIILSQDILSQYFLIPYYYLYQHGGYAKY